MIEMKLCCYGATLIDRRYIEKLKVFKQAHMKLGGKSGRG